MSLLTTKQFFNAVCKNIVKERGINVKKLLSFLILFALVFLFVACDIEATPSNNDISSNGADANNTVSGNNTPTSSDYTITYDDATTFEDALNSGTKVKGKVVKFIVNEYKPDSTWGVNCWAGEHLNFISATELDVAKGDIIIGRITEEPSKSWGSWKISYEVLKIEKDTSNNSTTPEEDTSYPPKPTPVFYSTNDYETATKGNTGVFSYKNKSGSYDVYWIIDFDNGYVYYFTDGNGNDTCDKVEIVSGTLNDRIKITWNDGGDQWSWHLYFKYKERPTTLVVSDHYGVTTEFTTADLDDAVSIRRTKNIKEY